MQYGDFHQEELVSKVWIGTQIETRRTRDLVTHLVPVSEQRKWRYNLSSLYLLSPFYSHIWQVAYRITVSISNHLVGRSTHKSTQT